MRGATFELMEIRRLVPGEGELYRKVRLRALKESPEAFSTTHESALLRDATSWAAQGDSSATGGDRATFIAFGQSPAGLAAIYRDEHDPAEGELLQVWIAAEFRGSDLAVRLMDALWHWAGRNAFNLIKAEVKRDNTRALRFYGNYGFQPAPDRPAPDDCVVLIKRIPPPSAS